MALGGGTFTALDKPLPGAYLNFVSAHGANAALSERGTATLPLRLSWGEEGKMFTVRQADFAKRSREVFGYDSTAPELLPVRELLRHAATLHLFRLDTGGKRAANAFAEARHPGARGNALRIVIEAGEGSTEGAPLYDVGTWLDTVRVDHQKGVADAAGLAGNSFVSWKPDAALQLTAGTPLSGGEDGAETDAAYQAYLDAAEAYSFNAMGCPSADAAVKRLFAAFCRRMREEAGRKFQVVLHRHAADYEGVVSLQNGIEGSADSTALIPWATGVIAGTAANRSATNLAYDGELTPDTAYTQAQLAEGLRAGQWLLHQTDGQAAVLGDINSLTTYTEEKTADFAENQTIRVLDQIANDIAVLFKGKYLGRMPNDASGRVSLWDDISSHHRRLQQQRAIEGFSPEDVTVEQGETRRQVVVTDRVQPVCAMEQLYMTVYVQ